MRRSATAGYSVGLHLRFASPILLLQDYPEAWVDHYTIRGFVLRDPTLAWAIENRGTIRWSSLVGADPAGVFADAAQFGLHFGATVCFGPSNSRSIGNFARADREFTDGEMTELAEIMQRLHEMSEPADGLTDAQLEALRCIADGDRHAAAAERLGISQSALKARLVSARQKLGARTTAEAIRRARDDRLF